jgi:Kef-type K+ transport system membrane component KefB
VSGADVLLTVAHVAVTLGVVLVIAALGRAVARLLRQPEVIGEIVMGLLVGPLAVTFLGAGTFHVLLPDDVRNVLLQISTGSLVLYLLGLAHHIRCTAGQLRGRVTGWVAAGALLPALGAGILLACWVLLMNTRGLTELIVLQVGYSTGILTTPMFLALIVMAVVTTVATGPLLLLLDRREIASGPPSRPELGSDAR